MCESEKHLCINISNVIDGCQLDMKVKNAKYIDKNNSLCQEFYFAHPKVKTKLNAIYNSHYTGSQLWKFGSKGLDKLESTYNRSIKIMFDLPWATHRYFLEPLTETPHMTRILVRRYLSFIEKIQNSSKYAPKKLLEIARNDVRTTTGSNVRKIMLLAGTKTVGDLKNIDVEYHKVSKENEWRIDLLKELVEVRQGELIVPGMDKDEVDKILEFICTT